MRFVVSSNPVRLLLIAPIGGGLVFARFGGLSIGRLGRFSIEDMGLWGVAGAVFGAMSILYVLPLLTWTDIRRSVPLTYGGALVAAIVAGVLNVGEPAAIGLIAVHVVLCVASAIFLRKTERPAMACPECHYAVKGIRDPRCPECGCDLTPFLRK